MRNLNRDSSAVASLRIAATGSAVRQIKQDLDPIQDDLMAFFAQDIRHETDPAGIMLMRRIVQTLRRWHALWMIYVEHRCGLLAESLPKKVAVMESSVNAAGAAHTYRG
jgi:hypothetical protein